MDSGCDRGIYHPQPVFADNYNHLIDTIKQSEPGTYKTIQLYDTSTFCGKNCNCKRDDRIDSSLEFADWLLNNPQYLPTTIVLSSVLFINPIEEVKLKVKLGGKCNVRRWGERDFVEKNK